MTIFYFTSTGNCLAVAKRIGGTLISIPQVVDSDKLHYKDDVIGLVFPIYNFTTPKIVRRFLDKVQIEADYTFAIGTYGNIAGAAMPDLQKSARGKGYRFDYVNQLLMVDNFLPIFEMGAQIEKLPDKKVEENLAAIMADIHSRKQNQMRARLWTRAMTAIISSGAISEDYAQKFSVNSLCNKCGICLKVCPRENIALTDQVYWGDHCEACLACVHLCPQNAIHLKGERSAMRWRNPDVTLAEIIAANSRR